MHLSIDDHVDELGVYRHPLVVDRSSHSIKSKLSLDEICTQTSASGNINLQSSHHTLSVVVIIQSIISERVFIYVSTFGEQVNASSEIAVPGLYIHHIIFDEDIFRIALLIK